MKNTLKQTKSEDKTVKSTQLSLVVMGNHDFQIFPDLTAHAWSVQVGNLCSVSVFFVRVGKERFKYPLPWENKISQTPYPRANKDNQIFTPCPASPPPLPAGITLIGALIWESDFFKKFLSCKRSEDWVIRDNGFGRNSSFWPFCYCFYSRLLFNCRSVQ